MPLPEVTIEDFQSVFSEVQPERAGTVEAAILSAKMIVDTAIIGSGCGITYSDDQLKEIIKYLAAHLWQQNNGGMITSISAGSTSESYSVTTDMFLKGTLHGQNAMLLDTQHCLAQLMADTDLALQGKQSYIPSVHSLHYNYIEQRRCIW